MASNLIATASNLEVNVAALTASHMQTPLLPGFGFEHSCRLVCADATKRACWEEIWRRSLQRGIEISEIEAQHLSSDTECSQLISKLRPIPAWTIQWVSNGDA